LYIDLSTRVWVGVRVRVMVSIRLTLAPTQTPNLTLVKNQYTNPG